MPILLNGQSITISSERARYHATRLNVYVDRQTPHQDLYALVDILVQNPGNKSIHTYSGYTLADRDWLEHLTVKDQQAVEQWLSESHIRYEIEGARRRLVYDMLPSALIVHTFAEKLYSRLRQLVRNMPVSAMPVKQWQQTLLNMQQQGISKEELHWSGVMKWLDRATLESYEKIDKQTILDKIDFFHIRLHVTNELMDGASESKEPKYRNKYRYVSLHGGEDYREWLVSLPEYMESYFGPHFTERNILLHIRSKTRFDTQGRKLLFIEEIQSDWHQVTYKNRSTLSKPHVPPAPYRKTWVSLGLKLMLIHAAEQRFDGLAWADGVIQANRYRAGLSAVQRIYNEILPRSLQRLSRDWSGTISTTAFESKVPWFRLQEKKNRRSTYGEFVKRPNYSTEHVLSILKYYQTTEMIQTPVFIFPTEMSKYVAKSGLPLFGEKC